jgi:site-specific DNA-cytosine methylase
MVDKKIKWAAIQPLIGGICLGGEAAIGHKPEFILSSEGIKNEDHIKNYWPNVPFLTLNNSGQFSTPEMKSTFESLNHDIDITVAVPICSGLSALTSSNNKNGRARGADAKQNDNMYDIAKIALDMISPKVHLFENAPSLYSKLGEPVVEKLKKIGNERNYSMSLYRTDTYLHGIPQHRQRTFAYFWKNETEEMKTPLVPYYKANTPDIITFLNKIPKTASQQNLNSFWVDWQKRPFIDYMKYNFGPDWRQEIIKNSTVRTILWYFIEKNKIDDFKDWCTKNTDEQFQNWAFKKLDHAKHKVDNDMNFWGFEPAIMDGLWVNAITAKFLQQVVHPTEDRQFKVREAMWLMGLPHDFELVPNPNGSLPENHIAQNVPVNTARDAVLNAVKFVNNELATVDMSFIKQNNLKQMLETPIQIKTSLMDFFV